MDIWCSMNRGQEEWKKGSGSGPARQRSESNPTGKTVSGTSPRLLTSRAFNTYLKSSERTFFTAPTTTWHQWTMRGSCQR